MASPDSFRKDFTHLPILLFQRNEGMAKSRGTTGRKKLKRDRFLEFLVPWPSNDEQAAAVSMLDEIEKRASATVSTSRSQEILVQKLVASAIGQLFLTDSGLAGRGSRPSAE